MSRDDRDYAEFAFLLFVCVAFGMLLGYLLGIAL